MIVLSWNCRGLGNRRAVQVLADLVRKQGPKISFLMETKLTKTELEPIQRELNFHSMIVVPSRGRSGGLALMWKDDVLLNTQTVSPNHIDAYVSYPVQVQWRLTRFMATPRTIGKVRLGILCVICTATRPYHGYALVTLMRYCPRMKRMVEYLSR